MKRLTATALGNLAAGSGGVTATVTTPTGQVVNIVNGIITSVAGNGIGSSPINPDYFSNLESSIGTAALCSDLQAQVDGIFSAIQDQVTAVNAQLAALAPILALLSAPSASPAAIVTWITSFITDFLTPYVIPYTTLATQLTELASQISSLTTAINNAAAKIPGCEIVIPSITGI